MDVGYLDFVDRLSLLVEPVREQPACGVPTAAPKALVMPHGRQLIPVFLNSRRVFHFRLHAYGSGLRADSCNNVLFEGIRNKLVKNFARYVGTWNLCKDQLSSEPIASGNLHLVSCVSQDFASFGEMK